MEVKLAGLAENPPWVQDMLEQCQVTQVYKFSKFQHAMAFLHSDKLEVLPHWFPDFAALNATPGTPMRRGSEGTEGSYSLARVLDSQEEPHATAFDPANVCSKRVDKTSFGHKVRNMRLLEPKSFFANERTFLHYVRHGIFVLLLIHFLPQVGSETLRTWSFVFAPALTTYFVWCWATYRKRAESIRLRWSVNPGERAYDLHSTAGPTLVFVISVFLLASLITCALLELRMKTGPFKKLPFYSAA